MCPVCACDACRRNVADVLPLRVASWNIKTLGKQFHHNQPAVLKLLAAVMLRMDADVICLMEVMEGFGPKHAVNIVEAMNENSDTQWRVRFPGTYTGAGGRNGLETYAVIYNPDLFELVSFELVGQEFGYSRDSSGVRQLNWNSPVVTRRPAQAVFRPLPTCSHFAFYPEFRVIIFHAPSVADKDYFLACHAIGELGKLPVFAQPEQFPYTILCADLNLDEEAANHVADRQKQTFNDMAPKSQMQAMRDIGLYNIAYQHYVNALAALTKHREVLAQELDGGNPLAQLVQNALDLDMWQAEQAAAEKSKGKKREERLLKANQRQREIREALSLSDPALREGANTLLKQRKELEQALTEAEEKLALAEQEANPDLPSAEEEVLHLAEEAFKPLANSGMFSNLSYSDDFRTTLRMSVHMACTRKPRAKYYDEALTLENFVYSNFDQVLVRTADDYAWGDIKPRVINLMGAVMPKEMSASLQIGRTSMPPLPPKMPKEQWAWLLRAAQNDSELRAELTSRFGDDLSAVDPNDIVVEMPGDDVVDVNDDDPVVRDFEPIEAPFLTDFLADPEVRAAALVTAFKRFVDMNNVHPHIELIRREAAASALEQDPIADFFNKPEVWHNRTNRNAVKHIADGQAFRLFSTNFFLALANMLSDHLPVIVEIEIVKPTRPRPLLQPVPPRFPTLFELPSFSAVMSCLGMNRTSPCLNIANCCGACDERTSLKTADGCLTGYHLVRAAAAVCQQFIARHHQTGINLLQRRRLELIGGQHWIAMAGHLLYVKGRSSAFAIARGTEYFWQHASILIGRTGIEVKRELCSVHKELAARKHPRILFAKTGKTTPTLVNLADTADDGDVQDEDTDPSKNKKDWSYPRIGKEFSCLNPVDFAQRVYTFLRTGICSADDPALQQALAALLVTMFGVEANKDNSTYLTGILLLFGIANGRYTVGEAFYQVDPSNECNLAGSLGLFPLASSERANLYGKRRCISGRATDAEGPWSEAQIMTAMLNNQPRCRDNIILKKEMVLLVDDVRARFALHRTQTTTDLLQAVCKAWWQDLLACYGDPTL